MNLYDLHEHPETLTGYNQRFDIPELAWKEAKARWKKSDRYFGPQKRQPDLEHGLAKDPHIACLYGCYTQERFIVAEHDISQSSSRYLYEETFKIKLEPISEPTWSKVFHNC